MSTTSTPTAALRQARTVERLVIGQPTRDGAGVTLTRVLTHDLQQRLDPFLMLDAFGSDRPDDYIAGFPDHPHRGFETVTYMIAGRMRHRDSAGHEGLLENGGVQWMTAGRGLIHSELPEQEDGVMEGFQLWLNLHSSDKMQAPGYRDIPSSEIPEWRGADAIVRVIAGEHADVRGAIQRPRTEPLFLDLQLQPGAVIEQPLPAGHHAFLYVYRGALQVEGRAADGTEQRADVPLQRMAILAQQAGADGVRVRADATQPTRALLIAGAPLREPIAQYGPFVMNSREQLLQAVQDFQSGRFA